MMGPPQPDIYDAPPAGIPPAAAVLQQQQSVPAAPQPPAPSGGEFHRGGRGRGGDHQQGGGSIPDEVVEYLRYFKRCVEEQNVVEIHNLYEYG